MQPFESQSSMAALSASYQFMRRAAKSRYAAFPRGKNSLPPYSALSRSRPLGVEVWLQCDLEGLLLFIEAGDFQPIITIEGDGRPQTKFELFANELQLIQKIAETIVERYDLSKLADGEKPSVRLRA